jgi:pimeloyl-ACP methyl ester carboxylesterase
VKEPSLRKLSGRIAMGNREPISSKNIRDTGLCSEFSQQLSKAVEQEAQVKSMKSTFQTEDGLQLYYEVTGDGFPIIFNHEFGGDYRSWEMQVRFFARRYKVITYNNRGFPPSDVPSDPSAYTEEKRVADLCQLLRFLAIERAHVVGFSYGANLTLNFGIAHPDMCASLVLVGLGAGSNNRQAYEKVTMDVADRIEREGMEAMAGPFSTSPMRLQLRRKSPRCWQDFRDQYAQHSLIGAALTLRGIQCVRPPIFAYERQLERLQISTLILVGDEDEACIEPALFMKRHIPRSGVCVFPQSGHTLNLEEPSLFNTIVSDFLCLAEAGKWAERGPIAEPGTELMPPEKS